MLLLYHSFGLRSELIPYSCRKTCRFVHYQLDDQEAPEAMAMGMGMGELVPSRPTKQAVPSYLQVLKSHAPLPLPTPSLLQNPFFIYPD